MVKLSTAQNSNDRKTISDAFRIITETYTFNETENESSLHSLFSKSNQIKSENQYEASIDQ